MAHFVGSLLGGVRRLFVSGDVQGLNGVVAKRYAAQNSFSRYIQQEQSAKRVVILDGGTGSEIGNRAPESLSEDSWTGAAQLKIPHVIEDIHAEYLKCGASIVTTNTYASNRHCLHADGVGDRTVEANQIGCAIAKSACEKSGDVPSFVLGSISTHPPNFKAAVDAAATAIEAGEQSEDSEKEFLRKIDVTALSKWPSEEQELENFEEQVTVLTEGGVDGITLEMVKDMYHGSLVLRAAQASGLPVVLGITIAIDNDDHQPYLRDDSILLTDALEIYMELCPNIVCINIMHSPAEYIAGGLDAVRTVWDGPMGCYPNNGTPASWPEWTEGDLAPEDLVKFASGWAKQGATLIGGCCGIGPAHIQALAQHFGKAK